MTEIYKIEIEIFDEIKIQPNFFYNLLLQVAVMMYFLAAGWVFWTAKTEDHCAPEWDYLFLLENGLVPADLCNRDTIC